nr:classical arabinogalactan protein 9-like [Ipomoea batatas]
MATTTTTSSFMAMAIVAVFAISAAMATAAPNPRPYLPRNWLNMKTPATPSHLTIILVIPSGTPHHHLGQLFRQLRPPQSLAGHTSINLNAILVISFRPPHHLVNFSGNSGHPLLPATPPSISPSSAPAAPSASQSSWSTFPATPARGHPILTGQLSLQLHLPRHLFVFAIFTAMATAAAPTRLILAGDLVSDIPRLQQPLLGHNPKTPGTSEIPALPGNPLIGHLSSILHPAASAVLDSGKAMPLWPFYPGRRFPSNPNRLTKHRVESCCAAKKFSGAQHRPVLRVSWSSKGLSIDQCNLTNDLRNSQRSELQLLQEDLISRTSNANPLTSVTAEKNSFLTYSVLSFSINPNVYCFYRSLLFCLR